MIGSADPQTSPSAPRRLYQIREGSIISGVCNGIAAYLNVDVTIMRIAFVVLVFLTGGFWLLAYIVMMFVIPDARTAEGRAARTATYESSPDVRALVDALRWPQPNLI